MNATTVYVLIVVFLATLIRSILGFGEALVAVPLLALRIPVNTAAPLAVLLSVVVAGMVVAQDWRKIYIRSAAWLVVASFIGIPFGLLLILYADDRIVKVMLGIVIACFATYFLTVKPQFHLKTDNRAWLIGAGFLAGVLGGAYGMNGPPLVVYGTMRRWSPQHFRATLQGYFLPVSLSILAGYAALGMWTSAITRYFLMALPGALAAIVIGRFLNSRLHGDGFYRYLYAGLIIIGGVLILQNV